MLLNKLHVGRANSDHKKRRYCRKLAFDEDTLGAIHSFAFCLVHLLWRLWSQMFVLNGLFIAAMTQLYADYDL